MKKILLFTFAMLWLSQLFLSSAQALSCAEIPSVEKAYNQYDGVVVGQVDEWHEEKNHNEIKITVDRSFKGINEESITFQEDKSWGNLNGPSKTGEQYLFFLKMNQGNWENPLCSPSMKVADASKELEYLKDIEIQLSTEEPSSIVRSAPENEPATEDSDSISWVTVVIMAGLIMILMLGVIRKRK